jgi:hypothetical protein
VARHIDSRPSGAHRSQSAPFSRTKEIECDQPEEEIGMAKVKFTLKNVTREISKSQKALKALRKKVTAADQKKIDLNLKALEKSHGIVMHICRPPTHFGQTFTTKAK